MIINPNDDDLSMKEAYEYIKNSLRSAANSLEQMSSLPETKKRDQKIARQEAYLLDGGYRILNERFGQALEIARGRARVRAFVAQNGIPKDIKSLAKAWREK